MEKNIEDFIKDGLIITIGVTGLGFGVKAVGVKPPGASLGGCYGYHKTYRFDLWRGVCKRLCSLQEMDQGVIQQQNFIALLRAIKLHNAKCRSIIRGAPPRRVFPTHVYTALLFNC